MSDVTNDLRAKILIAEDDVIVALDLQGMVTRLGYDVVAIVDTGQSAITAAQRFRPDIILLDLILNGPMDGIDVAREIHKSFDVPVVFCTSNTDLSMLTKAKGISYAGYLLKPINPDSLSTTLDTALYEYKLEKRVEKAETKYKELVKTDELLHCLKERKCAFEWVWDRDSLSSFVGIIGGLPIPVEKITKKIDAFFASQIVTGNIVETVASLIEVKLDSGEKELFALIGTSDSLKQKVTGLVIPLHGEIR